MGGLVGTRGQSWSMDLIIGLVIFLLAVGVIYAVLTSRAREDIAPLRIESEVVATKLTSPDAASDKTLAVAKNNQLDAQRLQVLTAMLQQPSGYQQLKSDLGVTNDFCIYLLDDQGNVVYLSDGANNYTGIGSGSGDFNISGTPCGKPKA